MFPFLACRFKRTLDVEESHIAALASAPGQPNPTGAVQELDAQVRVHLYVHIPCIILAVLELRATLLSMITPVYAWKKV